MVLAPFIVVPIIEYWGFRTMFYILGVAGVLVSVPAIYSFLHNTPEEHPKITTQELEYIQAGMEVEESETTITWVVSSCSHWAG